MARDYTRRGTYVRRGIKAETPAEYRRLYRAATHTENLDARRVDARVRKRREWVDGPVSSDSPSGPCEICGKHVDQLHFDHCAKTRAFRGWLCQTCNRGLGLFYDNPALLIAAGAYLASFTQKRAA